MNGKEEIIKMINSMSGSHSGYEIYMDWVKACALAIQNHCTLPDTKIWKKRESEYMDIAKKYGDDMYKMQEMWSLLVQVYEEEGVKDVLGEIFMEGGLGSKITGQFFTPFHISLAMAEVAANDALKRTPEDERMMVYEPSCGAAGNIIALAAVLQKRGYNYQTKMKVMAQDLDWKAVYTTYIQLSMLGIDAVVTQGDTLMEPATFTNYSLEKTFFTPKNMGILL